MADTKKQMHNSSAQILNRQSSQETLPPPYRPGDEEGLELGPIRSDSASSSASSSTSKLPAYEAAIGATSSSSAGPSPSSAAVFYPTLRLQIEAPGIGLVRFPLPPRNEPIQIFHIGDQGNLGARAFESVRPTRGSGNCVLFRYDGHAYGAAATPVSTTTYRFGPNRPPKIRLLDGTDTSMTPGSVQPWSDDDDDDGGEGFEVKGKGVTTRAIRIRTDVGTFQWRYASSAERRAVEGEQPDSMLVLERVHTVALRQGGKTSSEERVRLVGRLERGGSTRAQGSRRSSAGNGGRLLLDLRDWADSKEDARRVEVLAVTSCLTMLKREVDRRRMYQAMVIMGGASGGP